jgi:hypothetical protein
MSEPDRILAILGLLFSAVLALWIVMSFKNLVVAIATVLAVIACSGYLVVRKRLPPAEVLASDQAEPRLRLRMILNILFFILFSYSVMALHLRPELYVRPLSYFISIAVMVAVLALEILLLPPRKGWNYFNLLKIIMLGLSVQWSLSFIFPSIIGVDPWFHEDFTLELVDAGHIPAHSSYAYLSFMHLIAGISRIITGLDYKIISILFIGMPHILCGVLFIFLLGRLIYSDKVGLISALFLSTANMFVHFGIWLVPMTVAAILLLSIIYVLFRLNIERPKTAISLAVLLMLALILTHAIVSACLAILLCTIWAASRVYKIVYSKRSIQPLTLNLVVLFVVAMLAWWLYATANYFTALVHLFLWGFGEKFWGAPSVAEAVDFVRLSVTPQEWIFGTLGMVLFFAFSIFGSFYMMGKRSGNMHSFVIAIGGLVLLSFPYLAQLTGLRILEERWHYFAQIILAVPLGVAVWLLFYHLPRKGIIRTFTIIISSLVITFLMVMNPQVNMDNRKFTPNTIIRFAFTESELQSASTFTALWEGSVGTDNQYGCVGIPNQLNIDEALYSGDFSEYENTPIIVREEITEFPVVISKNYIKLEYNLYQALEEQGFSRVYDCGSVSGFIKFGKSSASTETD